MDGKMVQRNIIVKIIALLVVFAGMACGDEMDDKIRETLVIDVDRMKDVDNSWITAANRDRVVQRLKESYPLYTLLLIHDDGNERDISARYSKGDEQAAEALYSAGQASAIHYIIARTYSTAPAPPPPANNGDGDVVYLPQPPNENAADLILRIIRRTKRFPDATREWANDGRNMHKRGIANVQQWWNHNKEALLANEYEKASWVPTMPPREPELIVDGTLYLKGDSNTALNQAPQQQMGGGRPTTVSSTSVNPRGLAWPIAISGALLFSVLFALWILVFKKRS